MKRPLWKRVLRPGYKLFERSFVAPIRRGARAIAEEAEYQSVLKHAMNYVYGCEILGDYMEFGSFFGNTLSAAFRNAERFGLEQIRFFVFDSFEGLPKISGVDAGGHYHQGQYACDLEEFKRVIVEKGVDIRKVTITKGWYNEVLNEELRKKLPIKKAAVVWIDCDLYESTVPVLEFITPYIQTGTIICFDDWFCFGADPEKGECRAFNEWLAKYPHLRAIEYRKFEAAGHSFIMNNRKAGAVQI